MRNNVQIIEVIAEEIKRKDILASELARRVGTAKSALSRYLNKTI
ncbi:hypothetical protein ACMGE6_07755 [Macrococcus equi]